IPHSITQTGNYLRDTPLVRRAILATPARAFFEPEHVIIGTGRSGTAYTAALLRATGIRCGHENWWTLAGYKNPSLRLDVDASWIATFQLDGYQGGVFHQIRDPIRVLNSLLNGKGGLRGGGRSYEVQAQWVDFTGDDFTDALLIVTTWLSEAERRAEWTWRLEDVDAALLVEICDRIGRPISIKHAERAISTVATDTNRHVDPSRRRLTWDDLPDSSLKSEAMTISRQYGYL
ncbi:MAG: hypothetical protein WD990_03870, partial [Acidimicrobiia bacterium]